jgi:hypothetical protein
VTKSLENINFLSGYVAILVNIDSSITEKKRIECTQGS